MSKMIEVAVSTTAGFYPEEGHVCVSEDEKVEFLLEKVRLALDLKDTVGWRLNVAGKRVDPGRTYTENGLSGEVTLNWGPEHGGGGC